MIKIENSRGKSGAAWLCDHSNFRFPCMVLRSIIPHTLSLLCNGKGVGGFQSPNGSLLDWTFPLQRFLSLLIHKHMGIEFRTKVF